MIARVLSASIVLGRPRCRSMCGVNAGSTLGTSALTEVARRTRKLAQALSDDQTPALTPCVGKFGHERAADCELCRMRGPALHSRLRATVCQCPPRWRRDTTRSPPAELRHLRADVNFRAEMHSPTRSQLDLHMDCCAALAVGVRVLGGQRLTWPDLAWPVPACSRIAFTRVARVLDGLRSYAHPRSPW